MVASITSAKLAVAAADAIGLGNEVQREGPAARCESRVSLGRQQLTSRHVEVMQKVCQQHDVVRAAPIDVEGTTWKQSMPVGNTCLTSILRRDRQHISASPER